jgi:hypothetical protein
VIAHIVLLEPRADLGLEERRRAVDALTRAVEATPGISRFRIGRRIRHGVPGYEQAMRQDFSFVLILEFEDRANLVAYLQAPAHAVLGQLFTTGTAAALAYDYEIHEAGEVEGLGADWLATPRRAN